MEKKKIAALALNRIGLLGALRRAANKHTLSILAYHRIMDLPDRYSFDPELISASCDDFRWQVRHIKRYYNPISFGDAIECAQGCKAWPKRPVIISFDDGFDDNYLNAFRILRDENVPGTFFISTDYIGQNKTFWFDWVVYLVSRLAQGVYSFGGGGIELHIGREGVAPANKMLRYLKTVPNDKRLQVVDELERSVDMDPPPNGFAVSKPMTWEQVKEMAATGMEIGSHTKSHPILSQLSADDVLLELSESKREIESHLGKDVPIIAYPVGGAGAINADVLRAVKSSGYKAACTYISGTNDKRSLQWDMLRRIHVERYTCRDTFAAMLAAPFMFS